MTRSCDDAAAELTHPPRTPFSIGQSAYWVGNRGWDAPAELTPAELEQWRAGYGAAQDATRATETSRAHIRTWINALYDALHALQRIEREAPPKASGLRLSVRSTLTRLTTALNYVPAELRIKADGE